MTIKQLSRQYNVSCAAIRHYEKVGLLDERHITRGTNGYRYFTEVASRRMRFIKLGQAAGFSLRELTVGLQLWESGELTSAEKKAVFNKQLQRIQERIEQLQATKQYIAAKIEKM